MNELKDPIQIKNFIEDAIEFYSVSEDDEISSKPGVVVRDQIYSNVVQYDKETIDRWVQADQLNGNKFIGWCSTGGSRRIQGKQGTGSNGAGSIPQHDRPAGVF